MTRAIILALTAVAALSACNTVKGAGKDIQSGGAAITDEAQDAQKSM
jgi:predicted small secreted protein